MEGRDSRGASGDVAKEFETRIGKCGLLPLSSAGVEVSNKLHPTCTVVKGEPPFHRLPPEQLS
jgi:hypothetical protein